MSDVVIKAEHISKKYIIGHEKQTGYSTFRESLTSAAHSLRNKIIHPFSADTETTELEEFWALKDINFEIKRGDKLGIIGRNGAGKSTLLKILSRITEPTTGKIGIKGRVASLLEVGTGFHPELTGRENIFLNGSILGMTKKEIKKQFDEIVDFSGVEKFLDTPVKRYSSGMYVRLAFAVAAHLEPEILIIDEVLAVGDAEFQKKCLGKMKEAGDAGKTVLFVSHNMGAINSLTNKSIFLKGGKVVAFSNTNEVIDMYINQATCTSYNGEYFRKLDKGSSIEQQPFYVTNVTTSSAPYSQPNNHFECDQSICICISFVASKITPGMYGYITLQHPDGSVILEGDSFDSGINCFNNLAIGKGQITITIPPRLLSHGKYLVYLNFTDSNGNVDSPDYVGEFILNDSCTKRGNQRNGYFSTILEWDLIQGKSYAQQ